VSKQLAQGWQLTTMPLSLCIFYAFSMLFMFSATKTECGGSQDNPTAVGGNTYEMTSTTHEEYSTLEEVYDDIDEVAAYTELQTVNVKQEEQLATSSGDAPEPPPPRPHEYLELVNVPNISP